VGLMPSLLPTLVDCHRVPAFPFRLVLHPMRGSYQHRCCGQERGGGLPARPIFVLAPTGNPVLPEVPGAVQSDRLAVLVEMAARPLVAALQARARQVGTPGVLEALVKTEQAAMAAAAAAAAAPLAALAATVGPAVPVKSRSSTTPTYHRPKAASRRIYQ